MIPVNAAVQTTTRKTDEQVRADTSANGLTLGQIVADENLDKKDLKTAYKSIFDAYTIQWGKDGIEDTQEKLKGLQGKVGEKVYAVAKVAMEHCQGKLVVTRVYFLALCKKAEEALANKHIEEKNEEKPIGQLIPMWSQYKSSIAKGMELGIDPSARNPESNSLLYATASQYRNAVQEHEKKTGSQAGNERNSNNQTSSAFQLVSRGWAPRVSAAMDVLCQSLNGLTHEEQDKFADKILTLGAEVAEFVKNRQAAYADASSPENQRTAEDLDVGTQAALQTALDKDDKDEQPKGKKQRARAA